MKLYTEEQVMQAYNAGIDDGNRNRYKEDIVALKLTTIELPSDEEIDDKSALLFPYAKYNQLSIESYNIKAFQQGAKWMKEQILNQNK